jgi:hypothetical protein
MRPVRPQSAAHASKRGGLHGSGSDTSTQAFAASIDDDPEIYRFFIHRDPASAGTYYLDSAQEIVDAIKPSHTDGHVIESIDFLCDDPYSLCDRDLLGA